MVAEIHPDAPEYEAGMFLVSLKQGDFPEIQDIPLSRTIADAQEQAVKHLKLDSRYQERFAFLFH